MRRTRPSLVPELSDQTGANKGRTGAGRPPLTTDLIYYCRYRAPVGGWWVGGGRGEGKKGWGVGGSDRTDTFNSGLLTVRLCNALPLSFFLGVIFGKPCSPCVDYQTCSIFPTFVFQNVKLKWSLVTVVSTS